MTELQNCSQISSHSLFCLGFLTKYFMARMNKLYSGSKVTQGRKTKLTCDTQLGEPFHMGNGVTKLQHAGEPNK